MFLNRMSQNKEIKNEDNNGVFRTQNKIMMVQTKNQIKLYWQFIAFGKDQKI